MQTMLLLTLRCLETRLTAATKEFGVTQDTEVKGKYCVLSCAFAISFVASATETLESCPTQQTLLPSPEKDTQCTHPPMGNFNIYNYIHKQSSK